MSGLLLTGARGFIGRHTLAALATKGYEVHAVSSRPIEASDLPPFAASWHQVDLLDDAAVQRLVRQVRPTHLVHCAWPLVPGQFAKSSANWAWARAGLHLIQQFVETGGRHAAVTGTCFEYDWSYGWCRETTPIGPETLYGAAKAGLQTTAQAYAREVGLTLTWCRVFLLYGPHEDPRRLVASVINLLLRGEEAPCSHGNQIRDFLHVEDVAAGVVAALDARLDGPVNVGSGQPVRLRTIIEHVARIIGRPDLIRLGAVPVSADEAPFVVADVRRLQRETGWTARFELDRGLQHTIDWWRATLHR